MDFITLLGLLAGTLTTISFVPQLLKTWRTKSAKDMSLPMLISFCLGVFLWLVYGILLPSTPVIVANFITLILALMILGLKLRYE
jgi:MtN3 and saliva related transmembrane protein